MSYSISTTTASGSTAVLNVPFPYLDKTHVHVFDSGVEVPFGNLVWLSDSQVQLPANPVAGHRMVVQRMTPIDNPPVDFAAGNLSTDDLNEGVLHSLYVEQELDDSVSRVIRGPTTDPGGLIYELPSVAARKNNGLLFDSHGNVTVGALSSAPVSGAMAPVVNAASTLLANQAMGSAAFLPTIASLRSSTIAIDVVIVKDRATTGDNNGGIFVYDSIDFTSVDDGATVIINASGNVYKRQFDGPPSVTWWGADPTGIASSQAAFVAAWAAYPIIYVPYGSYKLTGTLTCPWTHTVPSGIVGDSSNMSAIYSTNLTGDMIVNSADLPVFRGLYLTRSSQASSGAGLSFPNAVQAGVIDDVSVNNQFVGISVCGSASGRISNVNLGFNGSNGLSITPAPGDSAGWELFNIVSNHNGGSGVSIVGNGATDLGQHSFIQTGSNTQRGYYVSGCTAVRLSDSFSNGDGNGGFVIVSGGVTGRKHLLTNCVAQNCVSGVGFWFDSTNVGGESLVNCVAISNARSGVFHSNTFGLSVTGGSYYGNGSAGVSGDTYGLRVTAGTVSVVNARAPVAGSQTIGISAGASVTFLTALGNNTGGDGTPYITTAATGSYVHGNF